MNAKLMDIADIERHKFILLIEHALKSDSFTITQACKASGLTQLEFRGAMYSIFSLTGEHERLVPDQVATWRLKPEAFFSYLTFLEFKHAVQSAQRAHRLAVVAICVSALAIVASLLPAVL